MAQTCDDIDAAQTTTTLLSHDSNEIEYGSISEDLGWLKKFVSFHDIGYEVKSRSCFRKVPSKTVLHSVNGVMKAGLNAIMGPTGSGKTSLLDILAGHKDKKGLSGRVLINGQQQPKNFKCLSAYVIQNDTVMGTLTVRENVAFSAALRLPSRYKWKDRKQKVNLVIEELELTHVADSMVGTEFVRGVSGGERKRTNIGMALIIAPGILFLDEPTTGLDASTAVSVIALLKNLAKQNRVIIISIHQPRYSIYKLFDTITLLSKGNMVYHGPAGDQALQYFSDIGHECEQHNNPADFFLDLIWQSEAEARGDSAQSKLALAYQNSPQCKEVGNELSAMLDQVVPCNDKGHFATSVVWQFGILSVRTVKNLIRNPMVTIVQVSVMIIMALLVGALYFQLSDHFSGLQNRIGAFFFILINVVFANLSAVELFIRERPIFIHESASGYYRISAFFFAKVFCDLIPMRILPVMFFSTISYWMLGLQKDVVKFFMYMLTLLLASSTASAIAFAVSAGTRVLALASLSISFIFVIQMVFGGFLVNLDSLGSWLSWLQYLSIFRYSLNVLYENELENQVYCDKIFNVTDNVTLGTVCEMNHTAYGSVYLEQLDYLEYNIWFNILALFVYIVLVLTVAYTVLRCIKKET